jgi:LacI family transcriptional regulator/LacI family repressor for deo operon, udp, cdd, tsx, nupC, and nupG
VTKELRRRVSIHDIADQAHVSHSTVSRALRGHPRISRDVRLRVMRIANELGYTPNAIAQSLQQQQSNTIGLVVADVADPFWGEVIRGVEAVVGAHSKVLLLSASHHDATRQLTAIEVFAQRRVDGIIIADALFDDSHMARLVAMRIPTVFVNSQMCDVPADVVHVSIDNYRGGCLAAEHLYGLGHRQLAYLGNTRRPASHHLRLRGFCDVLTSRGITPREMTVDVLTCNNDLSAGYQLAWQLPETISGIFCYNDQVALGALTALRERGFHIPTDISVVGFDDLAMATHSWPPLSSVAQPKVALGQTAMQTLIELLAGRTGRNHLLDPHMVVRQSSAPPSPHKGAVQ